MTPDRDEIDETPASDPYRSLIGELIGAVFSSMPESREREMAIGAVIELHRRLALLIDRPRLN
jgi:hypothetical protein